MTSNLCNIVPNEAQVKSRKGYLRHIILNFKLSIITQCEFTKLGECLEYNLIIGITRDSPFIWCWVGGRVGGWNYSALSSWDDYHDFELVKDSQVGTLTRPYFQFTNVFLVKNEVLLNTNFNWWNSNLQSNKSLCNLIFYFRDLTLTRNITYSCLTKMADAKGPILSLLVLPISVP